MSFANQVAVITGASTGIGHALARLAKEGCKVGLLARRQELLEQLRDDVRAAGGTAECAAANVAERTETVAALRDLAARLGPVDLLVANAGVGGPTTLEPFNTDVQERVVRVNFLGVLHAIEAVLPEMLPRPRPSGGRLQPGGLQGTARRDGLHRQQGRRQQLHGRAARAVAAAQYRRDDHLPRLRQDANDRRQRLLHAVDDAAPTRRPDASSAPCGGGTRSIISPGRRRC